MATMSTPWATPTQVAGITKATVTEADIEAATHSLCSVIGITPDTTIKRKRDAYFLQLAVAYQSTWELDQPDMFTRNEVASVSQSGQSVTFKESSIVLAPLAQRAIKKLSWRGTRTAAPRTAGDGNTGSIGELGSQGNDDALPFAPLTEDSHTSTQEWEPIK